MAKTKDKPKGDHTTQVSASLPEPYWELVQYLAGRNKASTAEMVRYIICTYLRSFYPNFPEYHFDPIPGPGPKRS